jgi:hypothetical protein
MKRLNVYAAQQWLHLTPSRAFSRYVSRLCGSMAGRPSTLQAGAGEAHR